MIEKGNLQIMNQLKRYYPLLGGGAAVAILALLLAVYTLTKPVPVTGAKSISIDVVYDNEATDRYQVTTEAQFLSEALNAIPDLQIDGTTSREFGLMITAINGKRADYQKDGAYWSLLCDGEPCSYGVSQQPIKDGEHYILQYTLAAEEN